VENPAFVLLFTIPRLRPKLVPGAFAVPTDVSGKTAPGTRVMPPAVLKLSGKCAMSGKTVLNSNAVMDLFNISEEQEIKIKLFLAKRKTVPLAEEIKHKTIEFRRKTGKKLPDSIIAASSILSSAALLTSDKELLNVPFPGFHAIQITNNR
jgi:hypothetical protein